MSREKTSVPPARNPMWLSLRAMSSASSAANRRRICSNALGGTIKSAVDPPSAGTSILARRCPLVATMRMWSGRSSQSTPFKIGRLSSVDAAKATWPTSLCTPPAAAFHAPSNLTAGNDGNSSRGNPSSLNLDRPHSMATRDSPGAVNRTGPDGNSRAMSTSFLAGSVTAPSASTSAGTVVATAMSRSVPERRRPCLATSTSTFARTGRVVFAGIAAATALSPSCSCSRVIVNFIRAAASPAVEIVNVRIYYLYLIELLVVVVEDGEMLVIRANVRVAHRTARPPGCGRGVGTVGNRPSFPTPPRHVHTGPHLPAHMWLQCGQLLTRHFDPLLERPVPHHLPLHLVHRVNDRRVIPPAERLPDLDELHAQHVAREIHRHLAGDGQRLGPGLGPQALGRDSPAARHHLLHAIDARRRLAGVAPRLFSLTDLVRERVARELDRDLAILERREQQQLDDAAFELPHARADVLGDEAQHVVGNGELEVVLLRLLAQDGDPVLEVRVPDVRHQPPLEPRDQPVLEPRDLLGRAVRGEHDLLVPLEQRVEGVEELFLRHFLAFQEMHIVDEEEVDVVAVATPKLGHGARVNRLNDLVDELLGPEVVDPRPRVLRQHGVGDRLHEVRLAEAGGAVDEKRVVGLAGRLRDGVRGCRGQLVRLADDEGLERVALIERRREDAGLI